MKETNSSVRSEGQRRVEWSGSVGMCDHFSSTSRPLHVHSLSNRTSLNLNIHFTQYKLHVVTGIKGRLGRTLSALLNKVFLFKLERRGNTIFLKMKESARHVKCCFC